MNSRGLKVSVNLQWCREATRAIKRGIVLRGLIREMIDEMPASRQAYWMERLRGVDNTARRLYDGPQVTNDNQDNSNRGIQKGPSS